MLATCTVSGIQAQTDTSYIDFSAFVHLDSIMITAKRQGFSVEEFIKIIQNDHSLEVAFNNLRKVAYTYTNDIKFYDNQGNIKASSSGTRSAIMDADCQIMEIHTDAEHTGDYFNRRGSYNYYTTRLYHRVFDQPGHPCSDNSEGAAEKRSRSRKILENRIDELKKLIYTPGREASIPLIGHKTAIFSEKMIDHYDFSLTSDRYESGTQAYVFTASIKPFFNVAHPNGSVVKFLEIYMDKENYQVLSRKYKLQYNAGIYNFDVLMMIDLASHQGFHVPVDIKYDGYWKVVGKKKENCTFHFKLTKFHTE